MGSKENFLHHLSMSNLPEIDPGRMRSQLEADRSYEQRCAEELERYCKDRFIGTTYEHLFECSTDAANNELARILVFLEIPLSDIPAIQLEAHTLLSPTENKFASLEVYRKIPGIQNVVRELGNCGFGKMQIE